MRRIAWVVCVAVVALLGGSSCGNGGTTGIIPPPGSIFHPIGQLLFYQYDFVNFGAPPVNLNATEFGGVLVQYDLPAGSYFFNSRIGGSTQEWQIQNLPITTPGGPQSFYVPLDLRALQPAPGQPVPMLDHGTTISDEPLTIQPEIVALDLVSAEPITIQTGKIAELVVIAPLPPSTYTFTWDGMTFTVDTQGHSTFTNQDCGLNECTPTAVSNSMKTIGVGNSTENSINTVKPFCQWTAGGCPQRWDINKAASTSGAPYNLTTTQLDPKPQTAAQRIATLCTAQQALKDGKDVEMDNPWHTAMVTRITKTTSGGVTKYYIWVAHDTDQGNAGGTKNEPLEYDPATNMLTGGTPGFFHGSIIDQFIIESK